MAEISRRCKCGCHFVVYEQKMHDYMHKNKRQRNQLSQESNFRRLCKKHAKEYRRNNVIALIKEQKEKKREAQRLLLEYKERKQNLRKRLDELDIELNEMKRQEDGTYGKPDDEHKIGYNSFNDLYEDMEFVSKAEGIINKW